LDLLRVSGLSSARFVHPYLVALQPIERELIKERGGAREEKKKKLKAKGSRPDNWITG
jgi:hypothetical protein